MLADLTVRQPVVCGQRHPTGILLTVQQTNDYVDTNKELDGLPDASCQQGTPQ